MLISGSPRSPSGPTGSTRAMPCHSAVWVVTFAAAAAVLGGCQGAKPPPKAPPPPKVAVAAPTRDPVLEYGEYAGDLDAIQRIEIRPQVRGRLMKVHGPEGTEIEKGRLLYEIDPSEYIAAKERAIATRERAVADRERAAA